jgi:hypothetical protein
MAHMNKKPKIALIVTCLCIAGSVSAAPIYVQHDAAGGNSGISWGNAYTNLQTALFAAGSGSEIWVAAGTYVPGSQRRDTFQMKTDMELYGGFNGTETGLNERVWSSSTTILSGDVLGDDIGTDNNSENCYQVVTGADGATLDGFTVTGGNADSGSSAYRLGGGMLNESASTRVRNCIFMHNSAGAGGGAMACRELSPGRMATTMLENCSFVSNSCNSQGGALYFYGCTGIVQGCSFSQNSSGDNGGGMASIVSVTVIEGSSFVSNSVAFGRFGGGLFLNDSVGVVDDCIFFGNTGADGGGGFCQDGGVAKAKLTMRDCIIMQNEARRNGGGLYVSGSRATVERCVFVQNRLLSGSVSGGGMNNRGWSSGTNAVVDCVFTDNSGGPYGYGGGLSFPQSSARASVVERCIFSGNSAKYGAGLYGEEMYGSPVQNSVFAGNSATHWGGGAYFNQCAPLVWNTTFAGSMAEIQGGGVDCAGRQRAEIVNCVLWSNSAPKGAELYGHNNATSIISYCEVRGGWDGLYVAVAGGFDDAAIVDGGSNLAVGPFAVSDNGTWTEGAAYSPGTFQSTFTDASANWTSNALKGMFVQTDISIGLQYYVVANDTNTLLLWGDYSGGSFSGSSYAIHDYHLTVDSPCVDTGSGLNAPSDDIIGVARPLDGNNDGTPQWDIGAYEYIHPSADSDADGQIDQDELVAGTDPTDQGDIFIITAAREVNNNLAISWPSDEERLYAVYATTNLLQPVWHCTTFSNVPGISGTMSYTNSGSQGNIHEFYKIGVQLAE